MRRLLIALSALAIAFLAAELVLRSRLSNLAAQEYLDPGLVQYDETLGWRLAPLARARHATADYDVHYATGAEGFRLDAAPDIDPQTVILGDSFTFGFGVADDETFAHHMKALNLGVPGYSTDQELMLLESEIDALRPRRVVLVVCLINDLFDNALPFPLQAPNAKPYFEKTPDGLALRNTPVPRDARQAAAPRPALADIVAGGRAPWWQRSILAAAAFDRAGLPRADFAARFKDQVDLFEALSLRMKSACDGANAELLVALLPGQALLARPGSASGRYQESLRMESERVLSRHGIRVLDLAPGLRMVPGRRPYFPNDGHLDATGHAAVAGLIAGGLAQRAADD